MFNGIIFQPCLPGSLESSISLFHSCKDNIMFSPHSVTISELQREVDVIYSTVTDAHTRLKTGRIKTLVSTIRVTRFAKHYMELATLLDKHMECPTHTGVKMAEYAVGLFKARYDGLIRKFH